MFFKDFVSVKRQKIKRGASQTYDTPSCFVIHTNNAIVLKNHIYDDICLNAISFLYPTQLEMPKEVASAVKMLMAI